MLNPTVVAKLTSLFAKVEPHFRQGEINAYREEADSQLVGWKIRVEKGPVKREVGMGAWDFDYTVNHVPGYVTYPHEKWKDNFGLMSGDDDRRFEVYKVILAANEFKADYKRSDRDANAAVDGAKHHFIQKQSLKVSNAIGTRKDIKSVSGLLEYRGVITGNLKVVCENGDEFTLNMTMIVNHRNANGNYTSFYQYPARFHGIHIGSKVINGESEKWMAEHFGGKALIVKIKAADLLGMSYVEDAGQHAGHTVKVIGQASGGFSGRPSPHYLRCKCSCGASFSRGKNDIIKRNPVLPAGV